MAIDLQQIRLGASYSNGEFGKKWVVWQVVDIQLSEEQSPEQDVIRYRIVVGPNRRKYFTMPRDDFASQVRYEVELVENSWQRVDE